MSFYLNFEPGTLPKATRRKQEERKRNSGDFDLEHDRLLLAAKAATVLLRYFFLRRIFTLGG